MISCIWKLDAPPWGQCTQCGKTPPKAAQQSSSPPRRDCPKAPSRGLGDIIAKATKAVGIKPCGGCKKRQKRLNELFPYSFARVPGAKNGMRAMEDRLLHAVEEMVSNGLATRSWEEIGRCLVVCQRCEHWRGDYCAEDATCPAKARQVYRMRLTRVRLTCDKWTKERPDDEN